MNRNRMESLFRILVTVSSLFGVGSRIAVRIPGESRMGALLFFTIQSNLMVALYLLIDIAAGSKHRFAQIGTAAGKNRQVRPKPAINNPENTAGMGRDGSGRKNKLSENPHWNAVHGAVLLYISMTGLIYNIMLASDMNASGFNAVVLFVNHTVTPVLFLIFWLLGEYRYSYSPKLILPWLIYPILYLLLGSIRGAATGEFRYPFLDFTSQSPARYAAGLTMVTAFFVAAAWIIISVNKWTGEKTAAGHLSPTAEK